MDTMLWKYLFWVLIAACAACETYAVYYLISLPMRWREKHRLFLDLIETGLKDGQSPSHTIVSLAKSGDRTFGKRLSRLAAHLENGLSFTEGLRRIPRLLPPQIVSTLGVGEEIGDIGRIVPAARKLLEEGNSQIRVAMNYLVVLLIGSPILAVLVFFNMVVISKFGVIFRDLCGGGLPSGFDFICNHQALLTATVWTGLLVVYGGAFLYLLGPTTLGFLKPWRDRLSGCLPWRRKRWLRDFSTMLSVLLDAGVPEERAVTFAARSTANEFFIQRAGRLVEDLREGKPLPQAIQQLDDNGELRWRLTNACHQSGGFAQALAGWHATLDAKAFREEQAAAQLVSTALVLLNGLVVSVVAIGLFQVFAEMIKRMTLW